MQIPPPKQKKNLIYSFYVVLGNAIQPLPKEASLAPSKGITGEASLGLEVHMPVDSARAEN